MTGTLDMYDSADPGTLPPWDGECSFAAYVDGYADFAAVKAKYPRARVMSITGHGGIAECADIERYLMADADGPGWYRSAVARGVWRPVLYRESSATAGLVGIMAQAGIARESYRLWSAHYEARAHICAPGTCGYPQADGTQWTSHAFGRNLDQSLLSAGFFTLPQPSDGWTFGEPRSLIAIGGHTSVRLEWEPPEGAPEAPAGYRVWVYDGAVCDRATLVGSYPRVTDGSPWEGGSLEQGRPHTAHVAAFGPGGSRMRPYVFASARFRTA